MTLSTHDHLVAATLAASRAAQCELETRDEYLAEYEAFLLLLAARIAPAPADEQDASLQASARDFRHIPCSV